MTFKIEIPKIFKTVNFSEFAEEFGEQSLDIWVNIPKKLIDERNALIIQGNAVKETLGKLVKAKDPDLEKIEAVKQEYLKVDDQMVSWYTNVWYMNGEPLSEEEVKELHKAAIENDPAFLDWIVGKTFELMKEHRDYRKN